MEDIVLHKDVLMQEDSAIAKIIAKESVVRVGLWFLLLCYCAVYGWFAYQTKIWLQPLPIVSIWAMERLVIASILLTLLMLINSSQKTLTRFRLEQNLRFDIYAAVTEMVSEALAPHLPNYKKFLTTIAVGEELLKPVKQISERAARLQLALQAQLPGLGLADAIHQIVRNALQANDMAASATAVETILTRIETGGNLGNVVQLEQRPSA